MALGPGDQHARTDALDQRDRLLVAQRANRPPGIGNWELVELLGVGGFGEVWMARHPQLKGIAPVALKFCLDRSAADVLRNEADLLDRVMQQSAHRGIVPLRQAYLDADPLCLEYELVPGGDLVADAVRKVLAERLSVQVVTVRIDIISSKLRQRFARAGEPYTGLHRGNGGHLGAQNDFVDLALARSELAAHRDRARYVAGVEIALRSGVARCLPTK